MSGESHRFLLPWHRADWEHIQTARRLNRLPHAILLTGPTGLGKRRFAELLAGSLLCRSPKAQGEPCGDCRGCRLFRAGTHPDYRTIEPEERGKAIRIDSIREYSDKGTLTAQAGGYKVVLVEPAESMNRSAANSLLKTLEEPVDWTLMILITATPGKLPATIRSRCQQLRMRIPERTMALAWLTRQLGEDVDPLLPLGLASGAPLLARELSSPDVLALRIKLFGQFAAILGGTQDPVAIASEWGRLDAVQVTGWYMGWLVDCIRLQVDPQYPYLLNPDQRIRLQQIGKQIESRRLHRLLDQAFQAVQGLGAQLNQQMVMEDLLLSLLDNGCPKR